MTDHQEQYQRWGLHTGEGKVFEEFISDSTIIYLELSYPHFNILDF